MSVPNLPEAGSETSDPAYVEGRDKLRLAIANVGGAAALIELLVIDEKLSAEERQSIITMVGYLSVQAERISSQLLIDSSQENQIKVVSLPRPAEAQVDSGSSDEPENISVGQTDAPSCQEELGADRRSDKDQAALEVKLPDVSGDNLSSEAAAHIQTDGRAILRIPGNILADFNTRRAEERENESTVHILIEDDKRISVDGAPLEMRVPKSGDPSVAMELLNVVLLKGVLEISQAFTLNDLLTRVNAPNATRENAWQALMRFKKIGLIVIVGQEGKETLLGLPEYVEISDVRPPEPEATTDFLVP